MHSVDRPRPPHFKTTGDVSLAETVNRKYLGKRVQTTYTHWLAYTLSGRTKAPQMPGIKIGDPEQKKMCATTIG